MIKIFGTLLELNYKYAQKTYSHSFLKNILLEEIELDDAFFILSLRNNKKNSEYLNPTNISLEEQSTYIKSYFKKDTEYYFIIKEKITKKNIGTVRVYNINNPSFCWGSWIIYDTEIISAALESCLLIYFFAFNYLQLTNANFDVRKDNKKVISFHKKTGAQVTSEDDKDVFLSYTVDDFIKFRKKFRCYLD